MAYKSDIRDFTTDQYNLIIAIKQGKNSTHLENFQEFWKKRCNNPKDLLSLDVYTVLSRYMLDCFNHMDYFFMNDRIKYHYFHNKTMTLEEYNNIVFDTISVMEMQTSEFEGNGEY